MKLSLIEKLKQQSKQEGECIVWTGYRLAGGYGLLSVSGRLARVHRVAWELANGPIPNGICVLHVCDNPPRFRIDHLFLGTLNDNNQDMRRKGRQACGDRHGMRTHPERRPYGERKGNARLTFKQVGQIREIFMRDKFGVSTIAKKFGVGKSTIRRILNNEVWRNDEREH